MSLALPLTSDLQEMMIAHIGSGCTPLTSRELLFTEIGFTQFTRLHHHCLYFPFTNVSSLYLNYYCIAETGKKSFGQKRLLND